MTAKVSTASITEVNDVKLSGAHINKDLTFEDHVKFIYANVSKNMKALSRQCKILSIFKRRLSMKYFSSQNLPTVQCSRRLNYKINTCTSLLPTSHMGAVSGPYYLIMDKITTV